MYVCVCVCFNSSRRRLSSVSKQWSVTLNMLGRSQDLLILSDPNRGRLSWGTEIPTPVLSTALCSSHCVIVLSLPAVLERLALIFWNGRMLWYHMFIDVCRAKCPLNTFNVQVNCPKEDVSRYCGKENALRKAYLFR